MAEAYAYAEDPSHESAPAEIGIARAIDRFGVEAVTGKKILRPGLISRIAIAESIVTAYKARSKAENWVAFSGENPELAALLIKAEQYAE